MAEGTWGDQLASTSWKDWLACAFCHVREGVDLVGIASSVGDLIDLAPSGENFWLRPCFVCLYHFTLLQCHSFSVVLNASSQVFYPKDWCFQIKNTIFLFASAAIDWYRSKMWVFLIVTCLILQATNSEEFKTRRHLNPQEFMTVVSCLFCCLDKQIGLCWLGMLRSW